MNPSSFSLRLLPAALLALGLTACADPGSEAPPPAGTDSSAGAGPDAQPDATAAASSDYAEPEGPELPVREIPNIPPAAEAYYAPDNYHVIAQTQDPDADKHEGQATAALTYIFRDDGSEFWRVNDQGQDGCSYFAPDMQRVVFSSTRDNRDMHLGNWSDANNYPQGAELYMSDWDGSNIVRLTDNEWYEAEVSISPNGEWVVFGRQIDGNMNLWRMRPDGSDEQQITFTTDWQPGAPFYMPDNETIMFRAWRQSEYAKIRPTPMTVFTIKHDGTGLVQRTFNRTMNWAPYPAPDGRHYVYVMITGDNNWEVYLGDLAGGEPKRLTFNPGFDGLPSISPDGTKMLFARSTTGRTNLHTHVMDVSSLDLGPANWNGVPSITPPADGMIVIDFHAVPAR
jgi:TolB protein